MALQPIRFADLGHVYVLIYRLSELVQTAIGVLASTELSYLLIPGQFEHNLSVVVRKLCCRTLIRQFKLQCAL